MRAAPLAGIVAACALTLAACGGSSGSKGPGFDPGAARPSRTAPPAVPVRPTPYPVPSAAGIVSRAGSFPATRGYDPFGATFDLAEAPGRDEANSLAVAPPWTPDPAPRDGVSMARQDGTTPRTGWNAVGGWLKHSGFGLLSIPPGPDAPAGGGYGLALGDPADIIVRQGTPRALAHMTWEGNMVAVQPGGTAVDPRVTPPEPRYGTVTLSFTGNGLDLDRAEADAETGALDVSFAVAGNSPPTFGFNNVPVTLRERSASTGGRDHAVSLEFGQGPPDNRIEGGIYGGEDPDEAAGVFEQGGWYGAFGANIEARPAFIPHRVWDGIHAVFANLSNFNATTPACTNLSCGFTASWLVPAEEEEPERKTLDIAVDVVRQPDGRDFRFVARDIEQETGYRSYGAWGNWSWFQASQGEEAVDGGAIGFGIPVSQGFSSPAFPSGRTGQATWNGKMAGIAYAYNADENTGGIIEAVEGNASLTVDFEAADLQLTLSEIKAHAGLGSYADIKWTGVDFADGQFRSDTHSLSGGFYGPAQEEVGGVFEKEPEGVEAGIVGAFGAKR